jgi:peptidyl-prolyl cis-trans isomerase B (cyclophilin B)
MKLRLLAARIALIGVGSLVVMVPSGAASHAAITCQPVKVATQKLIAVKKISPAKKYHDVNITLTTNCGPITIKALGSQVPQTVQYLSSIFTSGFYNNSFCHRITTTGIYVIQCGDPTLRGDGGPGFSYNDENLPVKAKNPYSTGVVAMANAGPNTNTNGSQFFIIYKDAPGALTPDYTVWGKIISGMNIVQYVASKGQVGNDPRGGFPVQPLEILKVSIR